MKKSIFFAAAVAMLGLAACSSNNSNCKNGTCNKGDVTETYSGILPAADCDGVLYNLTLEFDDNDNDGDYKLVESYLQTDTTAATGFTVIATYNSEGDFTVNKQGDITYLKLTKDVKDSQANSIDTPLYFVVDSDTSITMTGEDLQPSVTGLNYTLTTTK